MPTAPPWRTLKPFSTRALTPRWQATILPVKIPAGAGASQSSVGVGRGRGEHHRGRAGPLGDRGPGQRLGGAVAGQGQGRLELPLLGRGGDRVSPTATRWLTVPAPGPSLPAEAATMHAGRVGVEEGQLDRVGEGVGAAGDREVDRRRRRPGWPAATAAAESVLKQPCDAADLVDGHVRAGGDAVDRAPVDAERVGVGHRAAGGGGGGVGAVAVGVAGAVGVDSRRPDDRVVGVEERLRRRSACCCRRTRRPPGSAGCRRSRRSAGCRRPWAAAPAGCRGRRRTGARARRRCRARRRSRPCRRWRPRRAGCRGWGRR